MELDRLPLKGITVEFDDVKHVISAVLKGPNAGQHLVEQSVKGKAQFLR